MKIPNTDVIAGVSAAHSYWRVDDGRVEIVDDTWLHFRSGGREISVFIDNVTSIVGPDPRGTFERM